MLSNSAPTRLSSPTANVARLRASRSQLLATKQTIGYVTGMLTRVRQLFDTVPSGLASSRLEGALTYKDGTLSPPVSTRAIYDFEGNARYWSIFVPEGCDLRVVVDTLLLKPQLLLKELATFTFEGGVKSTALIFTRRIILYVDSHLSENERNEIVLRGIGKGLSILVRDRDFAEVHDKKNKPLAFISHDSSDKDTLVRELARELLSLKCPVWYDEYSLKVGDSLRAMIEKGLKETHCCVLVLSPAFLSNEGWGKAEFDSIFTREILEKKNVILPIWHNVTVQEVYEYSPRLADKVGLQSVKGIPQLARSLASAIRSAAGLEVVFSDNIVGGTAG